MPSHQGVHRQDPGVPAPLAGPPPSRERWPALPLDEWRDTRDTLQLWTQIVGKVRMANTPVVNHWWNVPLYVTATGLTTSLMPHPSGTGFQIDLDLHWHRLDVVTTSGRQRSMPLEPGPVAEFYDAFMRLLVDAGVRTEIWPVPVEIEDAIPFPDDRVHTAYDADQAHRFWRALVTVDAVLERFRAGFVGKASPVHLYWGALDLATSRFSGRPAPPHPGGAPNCGPHVMHEAYSREVSAVGYWPGGEGEGVFYSYLYPAAAGYSSQRVQPMGATWSGRLAEFVLPYEQVRTADDPDGMLLEFARSTYDAAADSAGWDRASLERPTAG